MKKILTKIIGASLAIAMMIGVGVGVSANKAAKEVFADSNNFAFADTYQGQAGTGTNKTFTWSNDIITITQKGNGATVPNDNYTTAPRWYGTANAQNLCTFTPASGVTITQMVFTVSQGSFASGNWSSGTINSNTWTGSQSSSFTFRPTAQVRPTSIAITYSTGGGNTPATYSVTYHDNNKTSGSVPTDSTQYESGQTITVAGNTGELARTGYTWSGWSLNQDGSGTAYGPDYTTTYTVASANVHFYPKWTKVVTPLPSAGSITIDPTKLGSYGTDVAYTAPENSTPGSEFGFSCTDVTKGTGDNAGKIQFKKGSGILYSTTPLSYIRSISITGVNASDATITYGKSADGGCDSDTVGTDNTYFKITNGNSHTMYVNITISYSLETPATLTGLSVASGLDLVKKEYDDGDAFDPTGLVIYAEWNDVLDTENNVLDDVVWTPTVLTGGTDSVTGTYTFGNVSKTVTVNGLTVHSPIVIDGNANKPANVPSTTNTSVGEGQINSAGVKYGYCALQTYSSTLEFNKNEQNAYIGNNESYGKFIRKIRLTLDSNASYGRVAMYKGESEIPGETLVSPTTNSGLTRIYNFNNDSEYFALKQTTTGDSWVKITSIEVFLGNNAPAISSVSASVKSGTYYATTTLSASDFDVTVSWTLDKPDTHPTDGFTWTVNGNLNGVLAEGNNNIVLTYKGVSSDTFSVNAAPARAKDVIESTLSTQALLKYHYSKGTNDVDDELTNTLFGVPGSGYVGWSNKTSNSSAIYAGSTSGGNSGAFIQLRSSNDSGIVSTASGGRVKSVTVVWNGTSDEGRSLDIYGKNSAYTSAGNLYGSSKGTKLGSIVYGTSTSLTITGDYAFIGVRSNSGALYLDSITVEWETDSYTFTQAAIKFGASISKDLWNSLDEQSTIVGYGVMLAKPSDLTGDFEIKDKYNAARNSAADVDHSFTEVAEKPYSLINNTEIKNYYNSVSTAPVEDGDNYIWYLAKSVTGTNVGLTKSFTAVAYIRTEDDEIIFLNEITKSAAQIAKDDIDADPNDELNDTYLEGSLGYLASLVA